MKQKKSLTKNEKVLKYGKGAKGKELVRQAKEIRIRRAVEEMTERYRKKGVTHGLCI